MTPQAQRIAIAEACGWTNCEADTGVTTRYEGTPSETTVRVRLPDYLNDLNAMHEAEKVLRSPDTGRYLHFLGEVSCGKPVCATAAQRAEAFLRTLGKWEGQG
jgi:hypothetical protein